MLIKEYRIPLPMTVEEYRIAQLYMIAKKSREESKGAESGVEILINEPYEDGPGGKGGQYTHKIYHVGSHLPAWLKSLMPKTALIVEEEAWNAYPYTKTRFKCPFVDKFSLECETYYTPDGGSQENIFQLPDSEKRNRIVDLIDIVKDNEGVVYEDPEKEDPTIYTSSKTGRGPLNENWIEDYSADCEGQKQPTKNGCAIMCAYKLCKVEFRYWGMQSKIERFIHDVALRKTMLKGHLQAWTWQDEWDGLTMEDIRAIERKTAADLKRRMQILNGEIAEDADGSDIDDAENRLSDVDAANKSPAEIKDVSDSVQASSKSSENKCHQEARETFNSIEYAEAEIPNIIPKPSDRLPRKSSVGIGLGTSAAMKRSRSGGLNNEKSSLDQFEDDEETDEFFDCRETMDDSSSLAKWSSMDLLPLDSSCEAERSGEENSRQRSSLQQTTNLKSSEPAVSVRRVHSLHMSSNTSPIPPHDKLPHSAAPHLMFSRPSQDLPDVDEGGRLMSERQQSEMSCPTTVLILVVHGGSVLDPGLEASVRKSDVTTFRGAFESVMRTHYPYLIGHVAIKCVPCPGVCTEALAVLSSLSPYSFDVTPTNVGNANNPSTGLAQSPTDNFGVSNDRLPVGTIPIFATSSPEYEANLNKVIASANQVYQDFIRTDEGYGFCGQICLVGDSVGSILAYDALCRENGLKRASSDNSVGGTITGGGYSEVTSECYSTASTVSTPRISSAGYEGVDSEQLNQIDSERFRDHHHQRHQSPNGKDKNHLGKGSCMNTVPTALDFDVTDFFVFGSALGNVLAYRKIRQASLEQNHGNSSNLQKSSASIPHPPVLQLYNLFHPSDPIACRIEPLLSARFSQVPPVNVARYQKYPMGDGACLSLIEFIQSNVGLFVDGASNNVAGGGNCRGPFQHNSLGPGLPQQRRMSDESIQSGVIETQEMQAIQVLKPKWWGSRRIDYALYCPEGLANFPTNSLPHLFHSSYWESADVISFMLRQLVGNGGVAVAGAQPLEKIHPHGGVNLLGTDSFFPNQPREKWNKKRTSVKIRNGAANHRANDAIVTEGSPQILSGRFSYGPLDMAALTGEKVDLHIMKDPPVGDWQHVATEVTDKHGRISFTLPPNHTMGYGVFPVRMLVRGDHSMLHMNLCCVPPQTETVVFSIDGSFAGSMSLTGKDPKVKAGAVDVVRHWQELGYLILYVTGRPDMQLLRVVSWLAQHNFPHGLVSFADGFSTDPLRHKADFLKGLISEQGIIIHKAYGSSKDISVYSSLGLSSENIYVVGKPPSSSRKQQEAVFLSDGYADHLATLTSHGGSRPAQGNARMVIPKATFNLPGQPPCLASSAHVRRRTIRQAKRTTSYPLNNNSNNATSSNKYASVPVPSISMHNEGPQSLPPSAGISLSGKVSPRRRSNSICSCMHGYHGFSNLSSNRSGEYANCSICNGSSNFLVKQNSIPSPLVSSSRPKLWRRNTYYFTRSKPT